MPVVTATGPCPGGGGGRVEGFQRAAAGSRYCQHRPSASSSGRTGWAPRSAPGAPGAWAYEGAVDGNRQQRTCSAAAATSSTSITAADDRRLRHRLWATGPEPAEQRPDAAAPACGEGRHCTSCTGKLRTRRCVRQYAHQRTLQDIDAIVHMREHMDTQSHAHLL